MKRKYCCLLLLIFAAPAVADEIRPGYLQVTETSADVYAVLWKVPMMGNSGSRLMPILPEHCREMTPVASYPVRASLVRRWSIECPGGLHEQSITITGLRETVTDVLAQFQWLDGSTQVARAGPGDPVLRIEAAASVWSIIYTYTVLGIKHILGGGRSPAVRFSSANYRSWYWQAGSDDYRVHAGAQRHAGGGNPWLCQCSWQAGGSGDCAEHTVSRG